MKIRIGFLTFKGGGSPSLQRLQIDSCRTIRQTGTVCDRLQPGAPREPSRRQDHNIRQRHIQERFMRAQSTDSMINRKLGQAIHRQTVSRPLKAFGIRCRRPTVNTCLQNVTSSFEGTGLRIKGDQKIGVK